MSPEPHDARDAGGGSASVLGDAARACSQSRATARNNIFALFFNFIFNENIAVILHKIEPGAL